MQRKNKVLLSELERAAGQEVVMGTVLGSLVSCLTSLHGAGVVVGVVGMGFCFCCLAQVCSCLKPAGGTTEGLRNGKYTDRRTKKHCHSAVGLRFAALALYYMKQRTV